MSSTDYRHHAKRISELEEMSIETSNKMQGEKK